VASCSANSAVCTAAPSSIGTTIERPEQRGADRVVMLVGDAVPCVAPAEIFDDRHQLIEPVETLDGGRQHLHQLLTLFFHVAAKHPFERRIELEQLLVEKRRRVVRDRRNDGEGVLDERFLSHGQHWVILRFGPGHSGCLPPNATFLKKGLMAPFGGIGLPSLSERRRRVVLMAAKETSTHLRGHHRAALGTTFGARRDLAVGLTVPKVDLDDLGLQLILGDAARRLHQLEHRATDQRQAVDFVVQAGRSTQVGGALERRR